MWPSVVRGKIMRINMKRGGTVTVNGATFSGGSITIQNGVVTVDGVDQDITFAAGQTIKVEVSGDVDTLETKSGDVTVNGAVGRVKTQSGDVRCGDVNGDAETMSGDITCKKIGGNARTMSGNIRGV